MTAAARQFHLPPSNPDFMIERRNASPVCVWQMVKWEKWMRGGGLSERTITERAQFIARFEVAVGSSIAADWEDIADYLARFAAGTRQTYHANLSAWFKWLAVMDYRDDNPMTKLRSPKPVRRKPRPLSLTQVARLLELPHLRLRARAMLLLGGYQGLRVSEIARVHSRDFDSGELYVLGKGGREDYLPIDELVAEIAERMPRDGYWFPGASDTSRPMLSRSVSDRIGDLYVRAEIRNRTAHSLRHFYGTYLLRETGNLALVQKMMRHASPATTVMYTEIDRDEMRAAQALLPRPGTLRLVT